MNARFILSSQSARIVTTKDNKRKRHRTKLFTIQLCSRNNKFKPLYQILLVLIAAMDINFSTFKEILKLDSVIFHEQDLLLHIDLTLCK